MTDQELIAQFAKQPFAQVPDYKEWKSLKRRQTYHALNQVCAAYNNMVKACQERTNSTNWAIRKAMKEQ